MSRGCLVTSIIMALCCAACSAAGPAPSQDSGRTAARVGAIDPIPPAAPESEPRGVDVAATAAPATPGASALPGMNAAAGPCDLAGGKGPLTGVWRQRSHDQTANELPIGVGDVLSVNVSGVTELNNLVARVSPSGTIELPLVGVVRAQGLTEEQLGALIRERLTRYVRNPQVRVFTQEYRSREVGVFGAVTKPGEYNVSGSQDTVRDMLSMAGGLTAKAADRVQIIPSQSAAHGDSAAGIPIEINLRDPAQGACLELPVRPGDTIVAEALGQVLVDGWVDKPGAYQITPGLGVLGAVAAAGGPLFPADLDHVEVIRSDPAGTKKYYSIDLAAVKNGHGEDLPVQSSDVIEVRSSSSKLVPYGVYQFFHNLMYIGASMPLIP